MKTFRLAFIWAALATVLAAQPALAAKTQQEPQLGPFRIIGNLYYVGGTGHGSYLVSTPQGLILINSNYSDSAPLIRQSVEQLGFKWSDIKILLISHAHTDHAGGSAQVLQETGAQYAVMQGDVDVVESGGKTDNHYGERPEEYYLPARVSRVLKHGDKVELGGTVLTAHLTPGHTKGTTTWTLDVTEDGKLVHVVIIGGPTLNRGMQLLNNPKYPNIVADYESQFPLLRSLPCDLPLGAHDWYFNLGEKYKRFTAGDKHAFIDPQGCRAFIDKSEQDFKNLLERQKAEAQKPAAPAGG